MEWGDLPWWLKAWLATVAAGTIYTAIAVERMERRINEIYALLAQFRARYPD